MHAAVASAIDHFRLSLDCRRGHHMGFDRKLETVGREEAVTAVFLEVSDNHRPKRCGAIKGSVHVVATQHASRSCGGSRDACPLRCLVQ